MTRPPLIGVTTSEVRRAGAHRPAPEGDPPQPEMALGHALHARARARRRPAGRAAAAGRRRWSPPLVAPLAGVCLSGGPDLDPAAYGARAATRTSARRSPALDAFELERRAAAPTPLGLPILGICRGAPGAQRRARRQLHQHLPDVTDGTIDHRQTEPGRVDDARRRGSSRARGWRGDPRRGGAARSTPSTTRRSTGSARGLRAVAWAPDGTIEGDRGRRRAARARRPVARRGARRAGPAPRAVRARSCAARRARAVRQAA